jgi:hypothetical protein
LSQSLATTAALQDLMLHVDDGGAFGPAGGEGAVGGSEARGRRRFPLVKLSSWAPQGAMADEGWTAGPKGFVAVSGWRGGPTYMYGGLSGQGWGVRVAAGFKDSQNPNQAIGFVRAFGGGDLDRDGR